VNTRNSNHAQAVVRLFQDVTLPEVCLQGNIHLDFVPASAAMPKEKTEMADPCRSESTRHEKPFTEHLMSKTNYAPPRVESVTDSEASKQIEGSNNRDQCSSADAAEGGVNVDQPTNSVQSSDAVKVSTSTAAVESDVQHLGMTGEGDQDVVMSCSTEYGDLPPHTAGATSSDKIAGSETNGRLTDTSADEVESPDIDRNAGVDGESRATPGPAPQGIPAEVHSGGHTTVDSSAGGTETIKEVYVSEPAAATSGTGLFNTAAAAPSIQQELSSKQQPATGDTRFVNIAKQGFGATDQTMFGQPRSAPPTDKVHGGMSPVLNTPTCSLSKKFTPYIFKQAMATLVRDLSTKPTLYKGSTHVLSVGSGNHVANWVMFMLGYPAFGRFNSTIDDFKLNVNNANQATIGFADAAAQAATSAIEGRLFEDIASLCRQPNPDRPKMGTPYFIGVLSIYQRYYTIKNLVDVGKAEWVQRVQATRDALTAQGGQVKTHTVVKHYIAGKANLSVDQVKMRFLARGKILQQVVDRLGRGVLPILPSNVFTL
jgi:hypothetical protein